MNDHDALLALALLGTARGTLPTPGPGPLDHRLPIERLRLPRHTGG